MCNNKLMVLVPYLWILYCYGLYGILFCSSCYPLWQIRSSYRCNPFRLSSTCVHIFAVCEVTKCFSLLSATIFIYYFCMNTGCAYSYWPFITDISYFYHRTAFACTHKGVLVRVAKSILFFDVCLQLTLHSH